MTRTILHPPDPLYEEVIGEKDLPSFSFPVCIKQGRSKNTDEAGRITCLANLSREMSCSRILPPCVMIMKRLEASCLSKQTRQAAYLNKRGKLLI